MNKKEYLDLLQKRINELNEYLEKIPTDEYVEKAITLGKINGLLTAKIHAIDLEK